MSAGRVLRPCEIGNVNNERDALLHAVLRLALDDPDRAGECAEQLDRFAVDCDEPFPDLAECYRNAAGIIRWAIAP